jgi:hypothetical protein
MDRRSTPGPPPGIFGPGAEDTFWGWAIPALAAVAATVTCGVWLAGEVTYLTGSAHQPGNPLRYVRSLIAGHTPWPNVWGWAALRSPWPWSRRASPSRSTWLRRRSPASTAPTASPVCSPRAPTVSGSPLEREPGSRPASPPAARHG